MLPTNIESISTYLYEHEKSVTLDVAKKAIFLDAGVKNEVNGNEWVRISLYFAQRFAMILTNCEEARVMPKQYHEDHLHHSTPRGDDAYWP